MTPLKEADINDHGVRQLTFRECLPPQENEIAIAMRFFSRCSPLKQYGYNSYWLKHLIDEWAGESISNGAVIVAAIRQGLTVRRLRNTPNAAIGVSVRSARNVYKETDHSIQS